MDAKSAVPDPRSFEAPSPESSPASTLATLAGVGSLDRLGFLAQLCLAAETPARALQSACQFGPLWSPLSCSLERRGRAVLVAAKLSELDPACAAPIELASTLLLWNELVVRTTGGAVLPSAGYFPVPEVPLRAALAQLVRSTIHYRASMLGLSFHAPDLERANPRAEPRLFRLLSEYAEDRLEELRSAQRISERLWRALSASDDGSNASAERLARTLGLSLRTLHRRLRAEGTSYRQVRDDFRKRRCLRQLSLGRCSSKRLALALGFASPASFHRAFKRWTGSSVDAYRRRCSSSASCQPKPPRDHSD